MREILPLNPRVNTGWPWPAWKKGASGTVSENTDKSNVNAVLYIWSKVFGHKHFTKVWRANKMQGGHWHIELSADSTTPTPVWEWKFSAQTIEECVSAANSFIDWLKEG